jgi:hypothetical protein
MLHRRCPLIAVVLSVVVVVVVVPTARAHETKAVGAVNLIIGWGDEPAFSGLKNAVEVDVRDQAGAGVNDPTASLTVDVAFGSEHVSLPLRPVRDVTGKFRAWLLPTRAGTYSFHVTGTIRGQAVDTTSTCSDTTFACVVEASSIQFPVKDPSVGQLAEGVSRMLPRADAAADSARQARSIGLAAAAGAALALVASVVALRRRWRTHV